MPVTGKRHGALRLWTGPAIVAVLGLGVAGCTPIQPIPERTDRVDVLEVPIGDRAVQEGGDLVMALSNEPDKLDPTTSTSLYTRYVMSSMCEKLYDLDAEGNVIPQLATALPTVSADGLTVTIPVRTDARFADGTDLDAAAVRTTLERNLSLEGSARKSELGPVTAIAVDGDSVRLSLDAPFAPLTSALADRAGMILSPAALADDSRVFADHPTCVGAFKFVKRIPQTSITLERDPEYYAADEVHLDTITYRIMPDANIRATNLRSGDVQVADSISPQDADALLRERGVEVLQTGSLGYQGLTVNIGNTNGTGQPAVQRTGPLAEDARVRQALSIAIDRPALVNSVFNNWYEPACSAISPSSPFATDASNACPVYDPERAKALLAEAGYETPVKIELTVSNTPDALRYAQALQASVGAAGFALTISPVEYSTLLDMQIRGDYDLLQIGWSGRIDPHGNLSTFVVTGAGRNDGGYSNPRVDELLADAAQASSLEERAALYGEATTILQEDNPLIYSYRLRSITAHSTAVAGVRTLSDGVVRLDRAAFLDEGQ